jgi:acetyltransferase-like isoleucine patch superfamily enzyme
MKNVLRVLIARTVRYLFSQRERWANTLTHLQYLDQPEYRQASIGRHVTLGGIEFKGRNSLGDTSRVAGRVILGYATTVGSDCVLWAGDSTITIGNYCQLAPRVAIYAVNHPAAYLTTYVNRKLFGGELKAQSEHIPVQIGHDVWIGHGAIILPGVTIGNGAIIGGGAIVTHDVGPYEIAAGNPARVVKRRFDPRVIGLLEKLQWWERSIDELLPYRELFFTNLNEDVEKSLALINRYLQEGIHDS